MGLILYANNAVSTLAAGISAAAVSLAVQPGDAAKFPSPTGGRYFKVTLQRRTTGEREIVHCTNRAGVTLTIVRAQEGTAAITFAASDIVSVRMTKHHAERFESPSVGCIAPAAVGDGVTDDTGAIQAAFDAGGRVQFAPQATYRITQEVVITKDRTFVEGNGAVLLLDNASGVLNAIKIANGVTRVNQVVVQDLFITVPPAQVATTGAGIRCELTGGCKFRNVHVVGESKMGNGFYISRGIDTWIDSCYVDYCLSHGIFSIGTNATTNAVNCQIFDTQIQHCGGNGIYAFDYTMGSAYYRNILFANALRGIVIDALAGGSFELSENVIDTCAAGGLYIDKVGGVRVVDNWFSSNGGIDIIVNTVPAQIIISANQIYGSIYDCMQIDGANVNINGNIVYGGVNGIKLLANALHTNIDGNTVTNCSAWGVNLLANPTNVLIGSNTLRNNATGNVSTGGVNVTRVGNSDQIPATGIVVGASPFSFTNITGAPLNVYVNGGNVSAVTLNGRVVFNVTDRMIPVPRGGVVAVTYTVLPTMVYEGLA